MVEVLMLAVVGELSAWQTKWETNGKTSFYKYKEKISTVFKECVLKTLAESGKQLWNYSIKYNWGIWWKAEPVYQ